MYRHWSVLTFWILAALTIALALVWASAQGLAVGIQGGLNIANVGVTSSSVTLSFDKRLGGVGGFFMANDINRHAGLQVAVLFSQKGTNATSPDVSGTLEIRVDYLEIPVLARVNPRGSNDNVIMRLFGRPSFAAMLDDRQLFEGNEPAYGDQVHVKSYDVGLIAGVAVEFAKRVVVDGRCSFGLIVVDNGPEDDGVVTAKNRMFTIMVGVHFK